MRKAPDAFRTISEAAELLDTPAHVLRFWESKFAQLKPVKRAGGRRYYRRSDIDLLAGIKLLLHDQGMTIRGVQKLLQEKGRQHVAGLAPITTPELVEIEAGTEAHLSDSDGATPEPATSTDKVRPEMPAPTPGAQPTGMLQAAAVDDPPPAAPVAASHTPEDAPQGTDADPQPDPATASMSGAEDATASPAPPAARAIPASPRATTRLAHLIRTQPVAQPDVRKIAPLAERLAALLAQMAQRAAGDELHDYSDSRPG
ncbi:MAG: MerR family transcriptional regulator [Rhodobacteraceae bacterium]|nr:MerR family transcriptional regulator [Paracoccaceae bacterium]